MSGFKIAIRPGTPAADDEQRSPFQCEITSELSTAERIQFERFHLIGAFSAACTSSAAALVCSLNMQAENQSFGKDPFVSADMAQSNVLQGFQYMIKPALKGFSPRIKHTIRQLYYAFSIRLVSEYRGILDIVSKSHGNPYLERTVDSDTDPARLLQLSKDFNTWAAVELTWAFNVENPNGKPLPSKELLLAFVREQMQDKSKERVRFALDPATFTPVDGLLLALVDEELCAEVNAILEQENLYMRVELDTNQMFDEQEVLPKPACVIIQRRVSRR